jgi:hypothetical protein
MIMLGTKWVAPGEGATLFEIYDALRDATRYLCVNGDQVFHARRRVDVLISEIGGAARTSLALTGAPIDDYDLMRVECDSFDDGM